MAKLKHFTSFISTNVFLNAAELSGWSINILVQNENFLAELSKNNLRYRLFNDSRLSVNNSVSTGISINKVITQNVLKQYTHYVADTQSHVIDDLSDHHLEALLNKHRKLVVKPVAGNNGVGITTAIESMSDLKDAITKVYELGETAVLIENHVSAQKEYRAIVWKGEIIDAFERIPAFVTGDGSSTIRELIEVKNALREQEASEFSFPIEIDADLLRNLEMQRLSLSSVPSEREKVSVRDMCNMRQGGEVHRVPLSEIHPEYSALFRIIFEATWLNYYGADLMTNDISVAPKVSETIVNELNASPGFSAPYFADVLERKPFYGLNQVLKRMETDPVQMFT